MNQTITYYDENAEEFCESTKDADMSFCRDKFLTNLASGSRILDAGCGSGRDTKVFLEKGYEVTAMDASKRMCEEAEKIIGQPVLHMTFDDVDFIEEFDGIWACASLLHVPRVEINGVLKKLWKALKSNGILYASFKYGTEERCANGRFFNDYAELEVQQLLEEIEFDIIEIFITKDVRENRKTECWVNVLARKERNEV